ncbi:MAG TPA: response regulator [Pyrinomonadaceae bacterium]|jgi:DNA-binding response OmpR family regulator|nr:response regulator [Pyrinomonadaceae bacterium]
MSEETNSHRKARPTIFLVEEDDDARPSLTANLRRQGYRVLVAADLEDAHEWVSGESRINADLVLLNLVRKTPEESVRLGRELREHAKYDGHTPLVVMPETVPAELEGKIVNVGGNDWVCYYDEDSNQLTTLLARLLNK